MKVQKLTELVEVSRRSARTDTVWIRRPDARFVADMSQAMIPVFDSERLRSMAKLKAMNLVITSAEAEEAANEVAAMAVAY